MDVTFLSQKNLLIPKSLFLLLLSQVSINQFSMRVFVGKGEEIKNNKKIITIAF